MIQTFVVKWSKLICENQKDQFQIRTCYENFLKQLKIILKID